MTCALRGTGSSPIAGSEEDAHASSSHRGDDTTFFQFIPTWRETAWRNAERLATAGSPAARAAAAASIEANAASQADAIRLGTGYGLLGSSATRDAYCSAHHG
jgi:hypothetical protein